jgi:hypothetical protein
MTTAPTITVRMAITIATIGRLIKNLDMAAIFAANGFGFTCIPWRTFCTPSATTRSPGLSRSLMIH